jgi:MoaA/NifB/PqqE/SkfB family radical SAM enzyme/SAM-dependent methyltransferase
LALQQIIQRIDRLKKAGIDTVVLSGGEPTIRPDFFAVAHAVQSTGLKLGIITNARMFAYKNFADRFAQYGAEYTQILVYSHEQEVHDRIAGVHGALEQTLGGIRNIAGNLNNVTVRIPVMEQNAAYIMEIPDMLRGLGLRARMMFSFEQAGSPGDAPQTALAAESVAAALDYGLSRHAENGFTFCWQGFAPCQIKGHAGLGVDATAEEVDFVWPMGNQDFEPCLAMIDAGGDYEECLVCSRRTRCQPAHRDIRCSFLEQVPNASGYEYAGSAAAQTRAHCPAGPGVCAGLHPLKDIAVLHDGALELYRTERHSSRFEMHEAKFARGQVYQNIAGRARNLDFRTAFRRLVLHESCRACSLLPARSGVFVPVTGDAFRAVQDMEKAWLLGLKGRILDIGCGRPLFPDILNRKISSGDVEYLGVDVQPECPQGLNTVAMAFEDFTWDGPAFDHIIMLRSYNHFKDPRAVLAKAAAYLKPGALLHIFENGLFAMLKKDIIDDPDHGGRGHQHFRNHFSEDVLKLLAFTGAFEPVSHTPVTPENANQWFITARRNHAPAHGVSQQ